MVDLIWFDGWFESIWLDLDSGILPFGSIFIEMYFIYASFWNYKSDTKLYIFLNLSFKYILISVNFSYLFPVFFW